MMVGKLMIEVERDEDGWHTIVIDISDDAVLYVTASFRAVEDAVRDAQAWIETND